MARLTPTVPEDPNREPVLTLTLVLPLATAARFTAFAARRGTSPEHVISLLINLACLEEDGTLHTGPGVVIGRASEDPPPQWAQDALADPNVMSHRNAYPLRVLPGCRSADHADQATPATRAREVDQEP